MKHYSRLLPRLLVGFSALALVGCGGGGSGLETSGLGGPVTIAPPPPEPDADSGTDTNTDTGTETDTTSGTNTETEADQNTQKGCAGRTTNVAVDQAIASGRLGDLSEANILIDIFGQLSCAVEDADDIRAAFFGLDESFAPTADVLTTLTWDPTHDAALLEPSADSMVLVRSNAVTREDRTVQNAALVIAGKTRSSRHLVFGSNPMRTMARGFEAENMTPFLQNGISWLTQRDDLATGDLNVVIAQMSQSYYFPDQTSVREWLDTQYGERVIYNAATECDDTALSGCLADSPDLLIISQTGEGEGVSEAVKIAMTAGVPILYTHHDGNLTDLGGELLSLLGARYVRDNYWQNQSISNFDGTQDVGKLSVADQALHSLLKQFEADDFPFDLSACEDKSCPADHGYTADFLTPVQTLKVRFDAFDQSATDVFALNGHRRDKGLVLLADHFRSKARFPMDKTTTPKAEFLRSMFADHVVHTTRLTSPVQADLGNFSRSDFSHVTPGTKSVALTARRHYSAAGVYAIPGQTVRVTRTDTSDVTTHIRVNLLRSGATHEFETDGYKRPKHLSSVDMPIKAGESLAFTSPHGGPIQVRFDDQDVETQFTFENVGEHAIWRNSADDADFEARMDAGDFDWAELITPGFQVHSTLEKMRETLNHPVWSSAGLVAEATEHHLYNLPHVLAGFKGVGIDVVPEIHDFATANELEIYTLDTVKHMNADQATCGYGCSGNPYDAYWDFNPIGHGDIHELGHGLERSRFRYTGQPGHTGTNPYSYFSKSEFYKETGNTSELGCQNLPYDSLFETVQASQKTADPARYMRDQNLTGWSQGAAINLQIMMAAQDLSLLENGYHLLARQHIIDREFNVADDNDAAWAEKKNGLGFGDFTRDEARALSNNDWNLVALSHALNRDLSDYLELWGFELSDAAKAAVADKDDFPTDFYLAGSQAHCSGFPTEKLPIDGDQTWPLESKSFAKFETKTDHHVH